MFGVMVMVRVNISQNLNPVSATVMDQTDAAESSNVINREQLFAHNIACCIAENG